MPVKKYDCELILDEDGYEPVVRGTPMFPCSAYWWDLCDPSIEEIPWHWHEDIEVLIVSSGTMQLSINGNQKTLHKGEGAFINSNIIHSIGASDDEISTLHSLVFSPNLLSGPAENIFAYQYITPLMNCRVLPAIIFTKQEKWMQEAVHSIAYAYEAYNVEKFGFELVVRDNLSHLWWLIVTNNRQSLEQRHITEDKDIVRLKIMIAYIHKHYADKLILHHIAAAANVSERECLRCFKKTIGISPIQYLLKHRMKIAARLLTETHYNITEISDHSGFDNPNHFSRAFKAFMSCSPSEYRKGCQTTRSYH
jgi:AraC-like DNA-binding protein